MPKLCIVLIIGIPGAGKSTFVRQLPDILPCYGDFQLHTIIYDDILRSDCHTSYKLQRQMAFAATENVIKNILQNENDEKNHVVVIDDNMYFKSMRYDYYKLAKNYVLSFFIVHFDVPLKVALHRNASRENAIPEQSIMRMAQNFEKPCDNWEKNFLTIDSVETLDKQVISRFVDALNKHFSEPVLNSAPSTVQPSISKIQNIDLVLRKLIHKKIEQDNRQALHFQNKKKNVFAQIKNGQIDVPNNLNDCELTLFLDTLL